jgi:predicted membrane GTPase involved in stress response
VLTDFAIEQCCSHRGERLQIDFAHQAIQLLPADTSTSFAPDARGLVIAAETEMALERPVRRLADVYGDMVRIGAPTVRYRHQGERIEQPIMGLRILCPADCYERVREDLRLRRAVIMDAELNPRFGIVRASAPLRVLIGYPGQLAGITAGRGQLVMWLSHYEQLDEPPPAGIAA